MSSDAVSFVTSLAQRFAGLQPLLEEHISDNHEILPHVFMGDVSRYAISLFLASGSRRELQDILDQLEEAYSSGSEEMQELISASFLENLPRPGERGAGIREMVGPSLRNQLYLIG